jgi:hypothetical protein
MTTTTQKKVTSKPKTVTAKTKTEQIPDLPGNPFAFEVLQLVSKQRSNAKKVEALRKYDHPSLKAIFIWNFDESIISVLPPGDVPYAATNEQTSFSGTLRIKGVHRFAKNMRSFIISLKVEMMD